MEEKLMPDFDFDTRKPQGSDEPNRPRNTLIANKLRRLLSASKPRILAIASTIRHSLMANRPRSLLLGAILLFVIAPATVGLLIYSFGRVGYPQQEAEYLNGKIAFEYKRGIWTMNADGSNMTPIIESVDGEDIALSPVDTKIAFTKTFAEETSSASASASARASGPPTISVPNVFVMNTDGSEKIKLLDSPAREPAWSPDGEQIAFSSDERWSSEGVESGECDIHLVDADGSGIPRRLTTKRGCEGDPAWSPDGTEIAFTADWGGNSDIYVVNADGSGTPRRLTDEPEPDTDPSWSPSGIEIAFTTSRSGSLDVYKMDADGSEETRLTYSSLMEAQQVWSSDGDQIAFVRTISYLEPTQIYKMDSDGTDPVLIRNLEKGWECYPEWWSVPHQDQNAEQPSEDEHIEQAVKDWQALPAAELQTYMEQINKLQREKNLRESEEDSSARRLAQKRTLDLLQRLDASHKGELVRFLVEADLVQSLDLARADLNGVNLRGVNLRGANLSGALLEDANLSDANLSGADLSGYYTNLRDANLSHADLSGADLESADLTEAVLTSANLSGANLKQAGLPSAYLSGANLSGANLAFASPNYADLSGTNLRGANLNDISLYHANLSGAIGITEQSLERQVFDAEVPGTLEGATMPDGSKHP
jgi:Tol biopolymer transport system component/uncharacterized protein YjbI with pentapeptide repeats